MNINQIEKNNRLKKIIKEKTRKGKKICENNFIRN